MEEHKRPSKHTMTGGRLMNLLLQHGYVTKDPTGRTSGLVMLSKLIQDGVTGDQFLKWEAWGRAPVTGKTERFKAIETDLCDLNEKLVQFGFPPLTYVIKNENAYKRGIEIIKNFGKKIIKRL